jgi:ribosomal protein L6P/L9E
MLWYGFRYKIKLTTLKKLKKSINKKSKRNCWPIYRNMQLKSQNFRLHKPFNWSLLFTKETSLKTINLLIVSPTYYLKIPVPKGLRSVSFDPNTNTFKIHSYYINNYYRLFWNFLTQVLKSFYSPTFLKLKFKGKGYYIYKNKRNTITPQFGYAHRLYLYSYFASVRFLSKTSIIIFGFNYCDLVKIGLGIKRMRPINIFTGRGVRFSKQIIYKKVGKVSSYR